MGIAGVPVVDGKKTVGSVQGRDLRFETRMEAPVSEVMTPKARLVTVAEGASDDLTVDTLELEDARWFDRATVRRALEGDSKELFVPPPFAVAHHIIRAWADAD